MIPSIREAYNKDFTEAKYKGFLKEMNDAFNYEIDFRVSESPIFINKNLRKIIEKAGEDIVDVIVNPKFKEQSENAIPSVLKVSNEDSHTKLIAIDFAICEDGLGGYIPQLIELQGFASLYCYQEWLSTMYRKHFSIPENFDNKFNGYTHDSFIARMKEMVLGHQDPNETVLLEIEPWKQQTQIDFHCASLYMGIPVVCLTDVIREGHFLFYLNKGKKTRIRRIYNRVIFDELLQRRDLNLQFNLTEDVDVEWVTHPNWFFRISKYTMPFLSGPSIPKTYFVHELPAIPDDLENWVLKPLFSFSGQGVIFDVQKSDILKLENPSNYILQKKVKYAEALQSPTGPVKCEIRLLYLWGDGEARPTLTINLGRMSKGKMIGVRYNQNLDWVGGTTFFLEKD
ncbi:MAG: hypothetical protein IPK10_03105 [Bacteroidetes bacterium]|nr:hypothetical protein [Bacteroidota bacterium]